MAAEPRQVRGIRRRRHRHRPTANATAAECYRVGNRLEAFVEDRRRRDAWAPALVEAYPDTDSLDQIYALARFFRHCQKERGPDSPTPSV